MKLKKNRGQRPQLVPPAQQADKRRQRRFRIIFIVVIVTILGGVWLVRYPQGYVNMFLGHYEGTASVLAEMDGLERIQEEENIVLPLQQEYDDWRQTHLRETLHITASADGISLAGDFYDAGSNITVIALHSFDGSRESDLLYVPWYAQYGYNIFIPDLRSHGESEGYQVTWGEYESRDLIDWMDHLDQQYGKQTYILHGQDLGASAALCCAGEERVAFIVAESPVTELYDAARYLLWEQFGLPSILMPLVDWNARNVLPDGRSMKDFSVGDVTENAQTPILLLTAGEDTLVDFRSVEEFSNSYSGPIENLTADGAGHGMVYPLIQEKVEKTILQYIARYVPTESLRAKS